MALNWSVEDVADYQSTCWLVSENGIPDRGVEPGGKFLNPVTEALIFASMSTGIGRISAENAAEVFARINFVETVSGPLLIRAEDPETGKRPEGYAAFITPAEVEAHIGLSTNASFKDETRAKWLKRFNVDLDGNARRYSRATEKVQA